MIDKLLPAFSAWLDDVMRANSDITVAAYNFNLYEHDDAFAVQLIGARRYDSDDPSWAEDELFTSGEDVFEIPHEHIGHEWRTALEEAKQLVRAYLHAGAHAARLKSARAVSVGFVDGDIDVVHAPEDA